MVQEREVVVHPAADRERGSPAIGLVIERHAAGVRSSKPGAAGKAMREQREIIHGSTEDGSGRSCVEAVVLSIRVSREQRLEPDVLVEVVGSAARRTKIHRGVIDPGWLQLT